MKIQCKYKLCTAGALMVGMVACLNVGLAQVSIPADSDQGIQVLTRGPVHEAFAETVIFNPEPGMVVPRAPREIIEELAPDQRPEGANVTWIPGYWAWDDERDDFLWVSGIWRALPPGRQWVPGYWNQAGQGYQWISGYWANAATNEVQYLPEPPDSIEVGPSSPAPSLNQGWVPGCWIWHADRYAWRPGYWAAGRADWDWVPAHYNWAPRGYIFTDGYWDHSVARRGMLFAPVYFDSAIYSRPGFRYSPSIVIDAGVFSVHLFTRPRYQHYYFGDYYANNYQAAGYYSSYSSQSRRYGYDPIYAHERWNHRRDRDWDRRSESDFNHRRDHEDARPLRTFAAQRGATERGGNSIFSRLVGATPLGDLVKRNDNPLRLQPVAPAERNSFAQMGREIQTYRGERQKLERNPQVPVGQRPAGAVEPVRKADVARKGEPVRKGQPINPVDAGKSSRPIRSAEPVRIQLPKPPIVAKRADQLGRGQAPPKSHRAPGVDPKIAPQPRRSIVTPSSPGTSGQADVRKATPPSNDTRNRSGGNSNEQRKNDKDRKN